MKKGFILIAQSFVTLIMLYALGGCKGNRFRHDEGMVWHTTYHITYEAEKDMRDSIIAVFNVVNGSLNVFDDNSLVAQVNAHDSVIIDDHFRKVFEMSTHVNQISGGSFDPTLGPLIDAWGFGHGHTASADTLRLDSLMKFVGISKTKIENNKLIKSDPRISFNFSAIAKGYGCDLVAEMLERNGISNYLVEIGGEIRCAGRSPKGVDWLVSIDRPIRSQEIVHDSQCVLKMRNGGLATSGNYRNFNSTGGKNAGHTISAISGRPVETDILSASVMAPTTMEADALATTMMAMGSKEAKKLAQSLKRPTLLILADSTVWEYSLPLAE